MKKQELIAKFEEIYGKGGDIRVFFAPGRVNLIGEHTDYNGGHVFPCALTLGTYGVARKRKDRKLNFFSLNYASFGMIHSSLDDLKPYKAANWTNYPKGVIWSLGTRGYVFDCGFDFMIYGNIPSGSGLSSSASLEVLTGIMLKDLYHLDTLDMIEIARVGQHAENAYCGMNCGIMDQFASAMGKKDHAIFLNTSTLHYEYAPILLKDAKIVITNSKVKHSLVDSKYNERRSQCERALTDLQKELPIRSLGDLSIEMYEMHKKRIADPICRRRAKHAVYENIRTIQAAAALKEGNIELFGRLMNESHLSLRDDYQVSCREIDMLVDLAWSVDGIVGSRITGGGFGGCTVSIVKNDAVSRFKKIVGSTYEKKAGHRAEFYVADIGRGASAL